MTNLKKFFKFPIDYGRYYGRMIEVTGLITTNERDDYEQVYVCAGCCDRW
jgi:hypothetical protein